MTQKNCPICGTEFEGRANKVYCSHRCKMTAFYGSTDLHQNQLTVKPSTESKPLTDKPFSEPLTVIQSPNNSFNGQTMETVPVAYTSAEKEMLERQAEECETVLPKLIRIRSLMEETDFRQMRSTVSEQKQEIEELRARLSFYQSQSENPKSVERITDKPFNGLLIEINEKQLTFLKEKYLESYDFEDGSQELLPDGSFSGNQRDVLEANEENTPGYILIHIQQSILYGLFEKIQNRLIENSGYQEEDFEDEPLIDKFDEME